MNNFLITLRIKCRINPGNKTRNIKAMDYGTSKPKPARALRNQNFDVPSILQIKNFLQCHRNVTERCRERLPIAELLKFMLNQTNAWSSERNLNNREPILFLHEPLLSLQLQTKAYNWVQTESDVKFRSTDDVVTYFISASGQPKLKESDITNYISRTDNNSWKSFSITQA
jgi:hypothetical protein